MFSKSHNMAVLIEFVTSSGLALFFHLVLQDTTAASILFGIGILLSLATYLFRSDLAHTRAQLADLYSQAHEIPSALIGMTDPECLNKAHEVVAGTKRTLALLQQGYLPLDETEFYLKSTKYLDECERQVKAVDPLTSGWDSRGSLMNYYQANVRALGRGVRITRVFVVGRADLADPEAHKVLLGQVKDGIDVRVAYREELPLVSELSGRDTPSSFDFAIYDDKVAIEVFCQPGRFFGRKTGEQALVDNYQRLFELIEHDSHLVSDAADLAALIGEVPPCPVRNVAMSA